MSLPTAFAMCPMAMNASKIAVRIEKVERNVRHTKRSLVRFAEECKEIAHYFVEKVFIKGLRVIDGKGRNKGDDHFPHQGVPRSPEAQGTFCCVHEILAHELR